MNEKNEEKNEDKNPKSFKVVLLRKSKSFTPLKLTNNSFKALLLLKSKLFKYLLCLNSRSKIWFCG